MQLIKYFILSTLAVSLASAQEHFDERFQNSVVEEVVSCSMLDGFLTHRIYKRNEDYKGLIAFQIVNVPYTDEELTAKQLEFTEWAERVRISREATEAKAKAEGWTSADGELEYEYIRPPDDSRRLGVSVPISSSNVMSSDQKRFNKVVDFFNSIFPSVERANFISFDMGKLFLDFEDGDCRTIKTGGLTAVSCTTSSITEMNGIPIERIELHMSNQQTKRIAFESADHPENTRRLIPRTQNLMHSSLIFYSEGEAYQSSFTYSPNGSDRSCRINGEELEEFID